MTNRQETTSLLTAGSSLAAGVVALLLALISPYLHGKPKKADLMFNHQYHIKDAELTCDICHEGAATQEKAGLPPEETCQACHEFDREKPSDACLKCHSTLKVAISRKGKPDFADVIFSHAKHEGVDCSDCHPGVEKSTEITRGKYIPSMDQCLKCHGELGVSVECQTCHKVLRKEEKPSSHGAGFDRSHGMLSELADARCRICHQESYCQECHLEKEPRNHTFAWKKKAHGGLAMIDRSSCQTCHKTDFCVACHSEARPTNHAAGWGNPVNTHCQACHLPLSTSGCAICHRTIESHLTVRPGDHIGNWIKSTHCVKCHLPFSATECVVCHREARHETAPDAGWHPDTWRDCRACHPSILTTKPTHPDPGLGCTTCHSI